MLPSIFPQICADHNTSPSPLVLPAVPLFPLRRPTGLFGVTIHQALFIAPCSHAFHYKCIRPLLETHHPAFSCPLCRTFADLEEDVEVEVDPEFDTTSIAEVAAIAVAATVVGDRPNTGDASSRERERERDPGAETEVEVEGPNRSRRRGPAAAGAGANHLGADDLAEDVDAEMEDVMALPPLPESSSALAVEQVFADPMDVRENSASPVAGAAGYGDVEVESGSSDGNGHTGEAGLHGKRKR